MFKYTIKGALDKYNIIFLYLILYRILNETNTKIFS